MDPKCQCGRKIDSKRDFNVEEIRGGVGDKGYKIAIVYCSDCSHILGAFPSREMFQEMISEEIKKNK
jgi:hypothetical protein